MATAMKSSAISRSYSTSSSLHNYYLRKRRKWPRSPYKTKWQETFAHQQAMESLRNIAQDKTSEKASHLLSALIDSFKIYKCSPSPNAYYLVIKTLIKNPSKWDQIPQVLDHIEKFENFETPEWIFVDLIEFFGSCDRIDYAIELFFRMPNLRCNPSVESLNALLLVLCKKEKGGLDMVPAILMKCQSLNIRIEESSFTILITALCRIGKVNHALVLLEDMVNDGLLIDEKLCSLILLAMCEHNESNGDEILGFMEKMKMWGISRKRADWRNLIKFFVQNGKGKDALEVLHKMKMDKIKPDILCYNAVLSAVVQAEDFRTADKLFDELLVLGLAPDINTYDVYINGLCKQNKLEYGIKMLSCMEELGCRPSLVTYNMILGALCEGGELGRARDVMKEMELKGMRLISPTYEVMICGLIKTGEVCEAFNLLKFMVDKKLSIGARTWEALVGGVGVAHSVEDNALMGLEKSV